MNITQLIGKKNNTKKLAAIVEIVKEARKKYGNKDADIDSPSVSTCSGKQGLKYLGDADKAALATKELTTILADLNCLDAELQGVNVKRELTGMIATNPILTNLEASLSLGLE